MTFSFLRDRDATSNDEPLASIAALAMSGLPPLNDVLAEMLDVLKTHFPANPALSLETRVSIVSVSEQSLGLGNRRGQAQRSGFPVVALKGGRLDAVVRFQAIANDPEVVETAIDDLHASLLAAKDALWVAGFLRVVAQDSSSAELIAGPDTWRQTADYKILYEYHYQDSDAAQSLIARIPIHSDPEVRQSPQRETTVVTDEMVRWDDDEPAAMLVVRDLPRVSSLNALFFVPDAVPGGRVTLRRTFDGAAGPPQALLTLSDFLTAIAGSNPVVRHAQVTFEPFAAFTAAFTPVDTPVVLGDWNEDGVLDSYEPGLLSFEPAIHLPHPLDRLEIIYQNNPDDSFDQVAVVYLRARGE